MLNQRQQRFVAEYLVCRVAAEAAIKAGYSAKTAYSVGPRLLRNAEIQSAMQTAITKLEIKADITQARVLAEVALLAFSDVTHYTVDDYGNLAPAEGAPEGVMRAVSSIKRRTTTDSEGNVTREVEFRLWDKPGIIKLAGRHVGLFPNKDAEAMNELAKSLVDKMLEEARRRRAQSASPERPGAIDVPALAQGGNGE